MEEVEDKAMPSVGDVADTVVGEDKAMPSVVEVADIVVGEDKAMPSVIEVGDIVVGEDIVMPSVIEVADIVVDEDKAMPSVGEDVADTVVDNTKLTSDDDNKQSGGEGREANIEDDQLNVGKPEICVDLGNPPLQQKKPADLDQAKPASEHEVIEVDQDGPICINLDPDGPADNTESCAPINPKPASENPPDIAGADDASNSLMDYREKDKVVVIDSSNDSSENEQENDNTQVKKKKVVSAGKEQTLEREKRVKLNRHGFEDIRTKGELLPEELPPLEELTITVDESVVMVEVGVIKSIVGVLVVIQSSETVTPLDDGTILFADGHLVLGQVFEVFGPVKTPWYSVRFNDIDNISGKGIAVGDKVYCAPSENAFTKFVFLDTLKGLKGSDASWEDNNEPPDKHLEYSDDESEKRAKAKRRNKKSADTQQNGDGDHTGQEAGPEKRNKWNKQNTANYNKNAAERNGGRPGREGNNPFQGRNYHNQTARFARPPTGMQQTPWMPHGQNYFNRPPQRFGEPPNFQNTPGYNNNQHSSGGNFQQNGNPQNNAGPGQNMNYGSAFNAQNFNNGNMNTAGFQNRGFGQMSTAPPPPPADFSRPPPSLFNNNATNMPTAPAATHGGFNNFTQNNLGPINQQSPNNGPERAGLQQPYNGVQNQQNSAPLNSSTPAYLGGISSVGGNFGNNMAPQNQFNNPKQAGQVPVHGLNVMRSPPSGGSSFQTGNQPSPQNATGSFQNSQQGQAHPGNFQMGVNQTFTNGFQNNNSTTGSQFVPGNFNFNTNGGQGYIQGSRFANTNQGQGNFTNTAPGSASMNANTACLSQQNAASNSGYPVVGNNNNPIMDQRYIQNMATK